jgi:parvulin-like peptidyl-prolyl isomerase
VDFVCVVANYIRRGLFKHPLRVNEFMTSVLKIGNQIISAEEALKLIASYQHLPRLVFEVIVDRAIASINCTVEEELTAYEQFCRQYQIKSEGDRSLWLQQNGMTLEQQKSYAIRLRRIEKFKQATWGHKLESYFLTRKAQLDKVIYSLIQMQDIAAQELYFRIKEGEVDFGEVAKEYGRGGLMGPVELSAINPTLAKILLFSQPGEILPPTRIGDWLVIVRLEKLVPAQLDDAMRQRLLGELYANWLQEEFKKLGDISIIDENKVPSEDTFLNTQKRQAR